MAVNLKSAQLKIFVYSGTFGSSNRGDAKYTLTKSRLSGESTIHFEISELVKDYLEIKFQGDPRNARISYWVETELTRTFEDTTTNATAVDNLPLHRKYIAFRGYGELYDINRTDNTNINPELSRDILISNRTVFKLKGEDLYIPFFTSNEKDGTFSVEYYNGQTLVSDYKFGGSVKFVTIDQTEIKASAFDDYTIDMTALRSSDSEGNQANTSVSEDVTRSVFTTKAGGTDTITIRTIDECKHSPYKISFLNKFGAIQELWFFKRSDRAFNVNKNSYRSSTLDSGVNAINGVLDFNTSKHVSVDYDINARKSIKLNTGFVTEDHNQVIKELLVTEFCWIHEANESGLVVPTPVKPTNLQFQEKMEVNEKLLSFTLDFEYSHNFIQDIR